MLNVVDDALRTDDKAAERSEGLRERAHRQIAFVDEAEVASRSAAADTDDARCMRIVAHDARIVLFCKTDDLRQVDEFAGCREDAIGYDKLPRFERNARETAL